MYNEASAAWIETHKERLLPETFIELTCVVTEPGLQTEAVSTGTLEDVFSEAENLVSTLPMNSEKYASLEWNMWGLDGSFEYFDETPVNPGYTTVVLSGGDASFTAHPTIDIGFEKTHTNLIPGITIVWAESFTEWASSFRISAYNGGVLQTQHTVEDNTDVVSVVWVDLQNYDRLTIEILSWSHPHRRARTLSVYMGIKTVYRKDDLISYSHSQSVDLLSAALPKNEISFSLRNDDDRWNPTNPTGVQKYLMERQEIVARYGMRVGDDIEWIDGGAFWLSGWNTPANGLEASFTARDVLEFMNEEYTGPRSGTLYDIATAVFTQANLPVLENGNPRYFVDEDLKNYSAEFADSDYTMVDVLQLVAHMACYVFYQRRDGAMYLVPRGMILSDYIISPEVSYTHPEFEISKPLKAVTCSYGYNQKVVVPVGVSGEVQTISNELISTEADALRVAQSAASMLNGRKTLSGEYRADPRLDVMDVVAVDSKYSRNNVIITDITYSTTGGAFRGNYVGKAVS